MLYEERTVERLNLDGCRRLASDYQGALSEEEEARERVKRETRERDKGNVCASLLSAAVNFIAGSDEMDQEQEDHRLRNTQAQA
ncbi:hypothetical protein C0J52_15697 [Blattella germanica]|nr:hypothetical protein C0J52_15697 [Blattella germanica]